MVKPQLQFGYLKERGGCGPINEFSEECKRKGKALKRTLERHFTYRKVGKYCTKLEPTLRSKSKCNY